MLLGKYVLTQKSYVSKDVALKDCDSLPLLLFGEQPDELLVEVLGCSLCA